MIHDLYYDSGFFKSKLNNTIEKLLWNQIFSTEWIADTDNIYKSVPSWYTTSFTKLIDPSGSNRAEYERIISEDLMLRTPDSLIEIGNQLLDTPDFDFFKKYYKNCKLKSVDMWNGSEEIPYHYDTINGCDTLVLIYLTEQLEWDTKWGGTILMKKEVGNSIKFEEEILPTNGTMLVINNANPLVFHKVKGMNTTDVNRYTFSFIYKWF
jgi:hypothetical protein